MSSFTFILQGSDGVNSLLSVLPFFVVLAIIAGLIYFLNQRAKKQRQSQPSPATTPPPIPAEGGVEYLTYSFENTPYGLGNQFDSGAC
jgi:hypothetical protein